ncbi:MAG: hypothetical protein QNJ34_15795 [Xenococcaceae cyanobacterium MO_188.B29]|nr:hypothetical protein [Xenococcaceae cyanobacterium MO_188.B29]
MSVGLLMLNGILPEVLTTLMIALIGIDNLVFLPSLSIFLLLSILFRLVWNSAIVVHGLGHTIAITIADKRLSALNTTNIFEHRKIQDIFKSLLPFQPIFIPFLNNQSPLWIAAGDANPGRIRIKALGGIGFNLIAASIALLSIPANNSADINLFLIQTFIVANIIIAVSSLSDISALISGIAHNFYCGNFGFISKRLPDDGRQLLPERMIDMYYQMGRETEIRGEQAGGGLVMARNQDNQVVFVGKKVVNKKRENLTQSLEAAFANARKNAVFSGINPSESSIVGAWHYRFATSGSPPSVLETHWHEWMSARYEMVWEFRGGKWVCQRKNVNHRITHNGDFDGWVLFDKSIEYDKLGLWLERVLYTANYTEGDSPKIAGLMDLLITKGMWYPSVRLAYQLAIAKSIEGAFDGQAPSANAEDTAPSEKELRSVAEIFENVFILYQRLLGSPDSPSCNQYACRLESDILQAGNKHSFMSQWSWQKRVDFVRTAIHAFFHNDLYYATKTFMSKAEGSFGLVTVSTLAEDQLVLSAQGQPISVGYNWQEGYMVYASEPAAVDNIILGLPQAYRLDLDQKVGEIALVSARNISIYSMSEKIEITNADLEKRWISMENHPYLPHIKYPQNDNKDPVESDSREIPVILEEIKLSWQNSTSLNCQSADYLVSLLCAKVQRLEQKREEMLRAGLTSNLQQLPIVDLLITGVENSLWLGEKFAQDLKLIFPWLNIQAISSNQVLQQLSQDFRSLQLGQDSIVLAITQSGQTFPTVQAINTFDYLYRQELIGELFILTGELGSFLGSPVLQPNLPENSDRHKVFVNGSGRRTAEPATIAVAAAQQTLTELLFYIAKKIRTTFPESSPFGMTLTEESLDILEKIKQDFLDINVVQIMGITPTGKAIDTPTKQKLLKGGRKWALHITESPTAWAIHAFYVLITVGWAIPFGYTIPLAKTLLSAILWLGNIPQDWFLLEIINPVVTLVDIGIYIFGSWLWTLGLRLFQGRQLLARMGKRTLVIGDVFWVNELLKSYVSKLFALSYGIASLEVHGANPQDDLLHDFAHRVVRGTLLFLGIPDGRRNHKFKQRENTAIMTGKQANGIRNINVGPEVLVMGSNPEIAHKGFTNAIILESNDDAYYFQGQNAEDQKEIIEELRESRFSAFERLLASYVFFWALAKKVASFPLIQYQHWKSQSRTKIMTTAAPVAGISLATSEAQVSQKQKSSQSESLIPNKYES